MLPPAGPEVEESLSRLLKDILHTIVLCKRSKRCTELRTEHIQTEYGEIVTLQWVLS
jgi:hypothetical protein